MSCSKTLCGSTGSAVKVHPPLKYLVLIRKPLFNVAQGFSPANESANFQ